MYKKYFLSIATILVCYFSDAQIITDFSNQCLLFLDYRNIYCIPSINETKSSEIVSYEYCDTTGYVYIPNVFNPSSEGTSTVLNRRFFVFANSQYVNLIKYFAVYDQLGRRVFEQKNIFPNDASYGWDGEYKNAPLMSGIYMWYVEIEYLDGQIERRSGDVALIYK